MHMLGMLAVTVALVPAPKEQVWRDGTCAVAEQDVRYVRDAALPPAFVNCAPLGLQFSMDSKEAVCDILIDIRKVSNS